MTVKTGFARRRAKHLLQVQQQIARRRAKHADDDGDTSGVLMAAHRRATRCAKKWQGRVAARFARRRALRASRGMVCALTRKHGEGKQASSSNLHGGRWMPVL